MSSDILRIEPTGPVKHFPREGRVIALMMSGGVDSSVAALLLQRQGWNVAGVTLRIPTVGGEHAETGEKAAAVARELGIPHFILHAEQAFAENVISPFFDAYGSGQTPNPCADCNRAIKFGLLMDAVDAFAGEAVPAATGHYVRLLRREGLCHLARGISEIKDQSYFLCDLPLARLHRLYFPLGEYSKEQVRSVARENGISAAERADSMEICFASQDDYRLGLPASARRPGNIVGSDGAPLGRHSGIANYTVGQRKGLGIAAPRPLYVLKIDAARNEIVAGNQEEAYTRAVSAQAPNVLAPDRLSASLWGKTRSRSPLVPCRITRLDRQVLSVLFESPQFAPAAGQRLVLYDEEGVLVVSGVIT